MTTTQPEPSGHDQESLAPLAPARSPTRVRPERRVAILTVALVAAALTLISALPNPGEASVPSPRWLILVLIIAFAVTEVTVFDFTFRRESMGFSLSEIPLAFCLV